MKLELFLGSSEQGKGGKSMINCLASALRPGGIRKGIILCALVLGVQHTVTSLQAAQGWGEFGGNFDYLRSCYTPPRAAGESNFYIDMLDGSFRRFALGHGLTNNHALFVVSHGIAIETDFGVRYAFYPEKSSLKVPHFSVGDLARVIGKVQAQQIHILVIAGCNQENRLSTKELKHYFPNATNIIHALPGTDANLGSFWEMLTYRSQDLANLRNPNDLAARHFGPVSTSKKGLYVAELYQPGARKPYRKQTAGRELLQPELSVPTLAQRRP